MVALGTWLAYRLEPVARVWPYLGTLLAAGAVPWTGGARSALLPYLLAPGLALGLTAGPLALVLAGAGSAAALLLGTQLPGAQAGPEYRDAVSQWVLLSLALGLVATWARRLAATTGRRDNQYVEVRQLLKQLRSASRHLPGALDAPSGADVLLDRCAVIAKTARAAVLMQPAPGALVPLVVRGTQRVPWRHPFDGSGPLHEAWESGRTVVDVRPADSAGRRIGSALAVLPLTADGTTFGLVVLESFQLDTFDTATVQALTDVVEEASLRLETALLFEEVRLLASAQERDRLARDMHDGIAQELAFLGYRLDDLGGQAAKADPALAKQVNEIRAELTSLISDIRLSITDLRTTVSPDRGLGAALSTYLRAVCSGKDVVLNLSLQETGFRLPAEHEVLLFNAAQAFAQEVRRSPDVRELSVSLSVDPPSARLTLECDGVVTSVELAAISDALARLGAKMSTSQGPRGGLRLDISFLGDGDDHQRAAGRRPRADPSRPAESLRAD